MNADEEDDRDFREERAAIAEFDGGLERAEAESLADERTRLTRVQRKMRRHMYGRKP